MENSKQAPFYVGQKVVALSSSPVVCGMSVQKGNVYRVAEIYFCERGDHWFVGLSGFIAPPQYTVKKCCSHTKIAPSRVLGGPHTQFAPYDPPAIEIPEVLLKEPVEERLDVKVEEVV